MIARNRLEEATTVSPLRSVVGAISWWEPIMRLSVLIITNNSACYLAAGCFWPEKCAVSRPPSDDRTPPRGDGNLVSQVMNEHTIWRYCFKIKCLFVFLMWSSQFISSEDTSTRWTLNGIGIEVIRHFQSQSQIMMSKMIARKNVLNS